jgi:hypothetical protein
MMSDIDRQVKSTTMIAKAAAVGNTSGKTLDLIDERFATGSIGSLRKDFKGAMWPRLGGGKKVNIPMGKHTAIKKDKLAGGVLLGAFASGALAAASLSGAGAANATCASISGIGNGGGCTSTLGSAAIGLGPNATATTNGPFNTALAIGKNSNAIAGASPGDFGNLAVNVGNNTAGPNATGSTPGAFAGSDLGTPGFGNVAVSAGNNNAVSADGALNNAFNIGGTGNSLIATGVGNNATNLAGSNNFIASSAGTGPTSPGLSSAFNIGGNNNFIYAGNLADPSKGGPGAIAGAIGTSNHDGVTHPVINQPTTGTTIKTAFKP